MAFTNKVEISGRAVRDAVRTGNGPFRFSLATGGGKKKDGSGNWPTEFFDVLAWANQIPDAERIRKGQEILVVGRLKQSCWEKDGVKHSKVEVVATALVDAANTPKKEFVPAFAIPAHPPREQRVAEARPITPEDPITNEDVW